MDIIAVQANQDNWMYLQPYGKDGHCWVADPSDAGAIRKCLDATGLTPTHLLATHHHRDHTAGITAMKKAFGCTVLGPRDGRIPDIDRYLGDGDTLTLGQWTLTALAAPGHTAGGICYYCTHPGRPPLLYAGDTLFACGCGRLLECTAETMYRTLCRLAALPDETLLLPGHDYNEENIRFALSIEPDNTALKQRLAARRSQKEFSPTTLGQEKLCNPFLRVDQLSVRKATGRSDPVEVFAELRRRKDCF